MRLVMQTRGFTLIELLVTLAIAALMMTFAAPMLSEYMINSRLREGGHALVAEALFAQSEAIKRNGTVQLSINGSRLRTLDMTVEGLAVDPAGNLLRERPLPDGVAADAVVNVAFGGEGRTMPFGQAFTVDLSSSGVTCSSEHRCPSLRVDAGGAVRLCNDRTQTCD